MVKEWYFLVQKKKNDKHISMPQLTATMIFGIVLLSVNIIQVF